MKKLTLSILLSNLLLTSNLTAGSVGGFGGATEVTQMAQFTSDTVAWGLDYVKQVAQLIKLSKQLEQDIMAVKMMVQNLQDLTRFDWNDFASYVVQLESIINEADGLSYTMSNYEEVFKKHYKGYEKYYNIANGSLTPGQKSDSFSKQYKDLTKNTRNTVKGTLDSLNLQANNFSSEQAIINTLKSNSMNAEGNKAVIQAANDIALYQIDQLRKLRTTMMTQINLQSQYIASENERKEIGQSTLDVSKDITRPNRDNNNYKMGF